MVLNLQNQQLGIMQCRSILIVQTVLFKDQLYICVSADLDELKIFFFFLKLTSHKKPGK